MEINDYGDVLLQRKEQKVYIEHAYHICGGEFRCISISATNIKDGEYGNWEVCTHECDKCHEKWVTDKRFPRTIYIEK